MIFVKYKLFICILTPFGIVVYYHFSQFSTCPALAELIKNITAKKIKEYPPALKEFACTLLFFSTSAYH